MRDGLHVLPEWRRPTGALDYDLSDIERRQNDSLTDAVYDLLWTPMDGATLLAEIRDEWGECTDDELAAALHRLRRAGHVRRRHGEYARMRSG